MESKSFVKILRKVIREEVRSAVKEILGEQKKSSNKVIDHGLSLHKMVERQENPYEVQGKRKKQFSKDPVLNDILNETSLNYNPAEFNGAPPSYPNMENKAFTSNDVPSFASIMEPQTSRINTIPTTDVNGNVVDPNAIPEHVTSALTKDYSSLMKAMDKKRPLK